MSDFNLAAVSFCPLIDLWAGKLLLRDVGTRGESGVIPPRPSMLRSAGDSNHGSSSAAAVPRPFDAQFNCTRDGGVLDGHG